MALNINFAKSRVWNTSTPTPSFATIGTVGDAGQMAAGHELAVGSFPASAVGSNLSWYNFSDLTDASGNGRVFTFTGGQTYGTDILGQSAKAIVFNGTSQCINRVDSLFDPADTDHTYGLWIKPTSWADAAVRNICSQWNSPYAFLFYLENGELKFQASSDGSSTSMMTANVASLTGWHHVAIRYVAATNTFTMYIDARQVATLVLSGGLYYMGGARNFYIGKNNGSGSQYFSGSMDEFFWSKSLLTENDLAKIYARKYSHNLNIAPISQKWVFQGTTGVQTRELLDNIVDMQANDLYYDLSGEASTTQVSLRLANMN